MKNLKSLVFKFVVVFMVYWTILYLLLMDFDLTYYFKYLFMPIFESGEYPTLLRIYSLILTFITYVIYVVIRFLFKNLKKHN